jgi:hypothetical protein
MSIAKYVPPEQWYLREKNVKRDLEIEKSKLRKRYREIEKRKQKRKEEEKEIGKLKLNDGVSRELMEQAWEIVHPGTIELYLLLKVPVLQKSRLIKDFFVRYKGGKCVKCGYSKCLAALDFHHLDPEAKRFCVSQYTGKEPEELLIEIEKCVLLCSNCHREIRYKS